MVCNYLCGGVWVGEEPGGDILGGEGSEVCGRGQQARLVGGGGGEACMDTPVAF